MTRNSVNRRAINRGYDFDRDFDRTQRRFFGGIFAVWGLVLLGNLIFWGVVIWAIIALVNHYT